MQRLIFNNLTGKLLLAMPSMGDTRFEKAVIFRAPMMRRVMGFRVNNRIQDVSFSQVLEQTGVKSDIKLISTKSTS